MHSYNLAAASKDAHGSAGVGSQEASAAASSTNVTALTTSSPDEVVAQPWRVLLSLTSSLTALPSHGKLLQPLLMYAQRASGMSMHLAFFGQPDAESMNSSSSVDNRNSSSASGVTLNGTLIPEVPRSITSSSDVHFDGTSNRAVLHMGGQPGLFVAGEGMFCPDTRSGSIAFYDLTLVALPYPQRVAGWQDLTAVAGHVVACNR